MPLASAPARSPSLSRPIILLLLFAIGIGIIWHLSQNVIPRLGSGRAAGIAPEPKPPVVSPDKAELRPGPGPPALPAPQSANQVSAASATLARLKPPLQDSASKAVKGPGVGESTPASPTVKAVQIPNSAAAAGGAPRLMSGPEGRRIVADSIIFDPASAEMRDSSRRVLDQIAELLTLKPELCLTIVGHTDNLGPETTNLKISADRALAVKNHLISRGIAPSRLESSGLGSSKPLASNEDQMGRQANRRIEFIVTSPK